MCFDSLPENFIQPIKKKEKLYEQNIFVINFAEFYICITITAQQCRKFLKLNSGINR